MDILGDRFGSLRVIKLHGRFNTLRYWLCKCACGNEIVIEEQDLVSGKIKACLTCKAIKIVNPYTGVRLKKHNKPVITLQKKAKVRFLSRIKLFIIKIFSYIKKRF